MTELLKKSLPIALLLVEFSRECLWSTEGKPIPINIRLLTALSSTGQSHNRPIRALITKPVLRGNTIAMPSRTQLHGTIRRAWPVGLGLKRERAALEIAFTHWETPDGKIVPVETMLQRIDNAREQVSRDGRIQGILAASNPLGVVRGLWYRPGPRLLLRAPAGLTGACGTVWSRFALGPSGAAALFGARLFLTTLPEPEIDLPPGTEMRLSLRSPVPDGDWGLEQEAGELDSATAEFLRAQPTAIQKVDRRPVADIINTAFLGPQSLVEASFHAAGWVTAEPLHRKSFSRSYLAFTERQGYPSAPVSKLTYQGRLPDLVFQKSLNSIAKRHHIRLWRTYSPAGDEIWLGAATHDVTVVFDRQRFSLSHRIDPALDLEREKVLSDLQFVEAVEAFYFVSREIDTAGGVLTDGRLAVARLRSPVLPASREADESTVSRKLGPTKRVLRRVILETRHYLFRENAYYLAYVAGRSIMTRKVRLPEESSAGPGAIF